MRQLSNTLLRCRQHCHRHYNTSTQLSQVSLTPSPLIVIQDTHTYRVQRHGDSDVKRVNNPLYAHLYGQGKQRYNDYIDTNIAYTSYNDVSRDIEQLYENTRYHQILHIYDHILLNHSNWEIDYNTYLFILRSVLIVQPERVLPIFTEMRNKLQISGTKAYNVVLAYLVKCSDKRAASQMYELMLSDGVKPDRYTYIYLIQCHTEAGNNTTNRDTCIALYDELCETRELQRCAYSSLAVLFDCFYTLQCVQQCEHIYNTMTELDMVIHQTVLLKLYSMLCSNDRKSDADRIKHQWMSAQAENNEEQNMIWVEYNVQINAAVQQHNIDRVVELTKYLITVDCVYMRPVCVIAFRAMYALKSTIGAKRIWQLLLDTQFYAVSRLYTDLVKKRQPAHERDYRSKLLDMLNNDTSEPINNIPFSIAYNAMIDCLTVETSENAEALQYKLDTRMLRQLIDELIQYNVKLSYSTSQHIVNTLRLLGHPNNTGLHKIYVYLQAQAKPGRTWLYREMIQAYMNVTSYINAAGIVADAERAKQRGGETWHYALYETVIKLYVNMFDYNTANMYFTQCLQAGFRPSMLLYSSIILSCARDAKDYTAALYHINQAWKSDNTNKLVTEQLKSPSMYKDSKIFDRLSLHYVFTCLTEHKQYTAITQLYMTCIAHKQPLLRRTYPLIIAAINQTSNTNINSNSNDITVIQENKTQLLQILQQMLHTCSRSTILDAQIYVELIQIQSTFPRIESDCIATLKHFVRQIHGMIQTLNTSNKDSDQYKQLQDTILHHRIVLSEIYNIIIHNARYGAETCTLSFIDTIYTKYRLHCEQKLIARPLRDIDYNNILYIYCQQKPEQVYHVFCKIPTTHIKSHAYAIVLESFHRAINHTGVKRIVRDLLENRTGVLGHTICMSALKLLAKIHCIDMYVELVVHYINRSHATCTQASFNNMLNQLHHIPYIAVEKRPNSSALNDLYFRLKERLRPINVYIEYYRTLCQYAGSVGEIDICIKIYSTILQRAHDNPHSQKTLSGMCHRITYTDIYTVLRSCLLYGTAEQLQLLCNIPQQPYFVYALPEATGDIQSAINNMHGRIRDTDIYINKLHKLYNSGITESIDIRDATAQNTIYDRIYDACTYGEYHTLIDLVQSILRSFVTDTDIRSAREHTVELTRMKHTLLSSDKHKLIAPIVKHCVIGLTHHCIVQRDAVNKGRKTREQTQHNTTTSNGHQNMMQHNTLIDPRQEVLITI